MKIKIHFIIPAAAFVFSALSLPAMAQETWTASPGVVEKTAKAQPSFNFYENKVPAYSLPGLMVSSTGKEIRSAADWTEIRRPELLEMFREEVFGKVPATPYTISFIPLMTDKTAMNGAATLKQVDINISSGGKSLVIHYTLFVPNNIKKPVPAFLLIDNRGPGNIDPERKIRTEFWPAEEVIARGYAISAFSNSDVDPDNFDDFKNGIHGILDRGERKPDSWATLAAWAWGASRCLDYLVTDSDIDAGKVAVVGHSRGGKTALWAGAEDQRFSIVIANESGCGGAALARRKFGETVERINSSFPHWFCTNYRKYSGKEETMPFDMHMLLALTAPKALYIDCADDDLWGDPEGCYLALYNAIPAFQLFSREKIQIPELMPPLNRQLISGNVGFHIRNGVHDLKLQDWNCFMDFAKRIWGR